MNLTESIKDHFSWTNPKLELKQSNLHGKGLFAKQKISKDEQLAVFGGYVMRRDQALVFPEEISDECINVTENLVMGVKYESEVERASFFNHCCDPNAGMKGQIFLIAMRDIKEGEEITFDYATTLCDEVKPYALKCLCGTKNCRNVITDNDWKNESLQRKYAGYFSLFIEEKINKIIIVRKTE